MLRFIESLVMWLKRVVTQPQEELNRWQIAVRFAYDVGRFGARQMQQDRAHLMAAALSFRTLFGLLPVLVVATVLVKAFGVEEHFLEPLGQLFGFWGLDEVQIVPGSDADPSTTLDIWLQDRVREAERVNVAAIGWVGVAVTAYAAISLMVTIENCFNAIYRAPRGRAWVSRVPVYWFLLTLSPLLIIFSTYVDAGFRQFMDNVQARGWVGSTLGGLWSMLIIWLLMSAVYTLFPNALVRFRHAMAGALVAAILLEFGKRTMGIYLSQALSISQLYGSLGLVPLFMFWVYLMWMAVLFGLQVSSILAHLRGRRLEELAAQEAGPILVEPAVVTLLMQQVASRFREGKAINSEQLALATGVPESVVQPLVQQLEQRGLLHHVADTPDDRVTLSRPPETIAIRQLLEVAFAMSEHDGEPSVLFQQLRDAQQHSVGDQMLSDAL